MDRVRFCVRGVGQESVDRLRAVSRSSRLPMGAIFDECVEVYWDSLDEEDDEDEIDTET